MKIAAKLGVPVARLRVKKEEQRYGVRGGTTRDAVIGGVFGRYPQAQKTDAGASPAVLPD